MSHALTHEKMACPGLNPVPLFGSVSRQVGTSPNNRNNLLPPLTSANFAAMT